jgi:hypothetical protein
MKSVFFCLLVLLTHASPLKAEDCSAREKLLSTVAGEWVAQGMYAAAKLGVADHLFNGEESVATLATLCSCNEDSLYRLLRMLASCGIFEERENRIFRNNEASSLLAKNHPQSLNSLVLFYSEEMSASWDLCSESIKNGKPAFQLTYEKPVFDYFRQKPQAGARFRSAMKEKSSLVISSCLNSFDFGRFKSFYDIGGGMGQFLSALLTTFPGATGTLFELPEVIDAARSLLKKAMLVSGDFFQSVPQGGDAYLLKSILHDWSDEDCLKILMKCRDAMSQNSTLLIVEPLVSSLMGRDYAKVMDVYMMMITGGKERTQKEFEALLERAGFIIESISHTETEFSIIEAKKR